MYEIENFEKKKKSLILVLMQDKFEEKMKEQISAHSWTSMDELDAYLDQQLQKFYEECDAIENYYDKRITGGDPFMNENFLEVFEYCRHKGFVADIFTNGLWLAAHPHELKKVLVLNPRAFYISLYGASSSIHDRITGVPGSFNKTIDVVKTIHAARIPVVLNIMILAENYFDLERIITLAR